MTYDPLYSNTPPLRNVILVVRKMNIFCGVNSIHPEILLVNIAFGFLCVCVCFVCTPNLSVQFSECFKLHICLVALFCGDFGGSST